MVANARDIVKGAAATFVEEQFKGPTTLRENLTAVATGVTDVLPNDPERLGWMIVNHGANIGYLGFSREVAVGNGVFLAAGGGSASVNIVEDQELVTRAVYGIMAVLGGNWYTVEVLRVTAPSIEAEG